MANVSEQLTIAEQVALKKVLTDREFDNAKEMFPQGHEQEVNMMVRVSGLVKKGVDTTTLSWPKAKWDLLAAIALSNMNEATREKIGREYLELMADADGAEAKESLVAKQGKVKKDAESWTQTIMQKTEVVRKGTVTFSGALEVITEPQEDKLTA